MNSKESRPQHSSEHRGFSRIIQPNKNSSLKEYDSIEAKYTSRRLNNTIDGAINNKKSRVLLHSKLDTSDIEGTKPKPLPRARVNYSLVSKDIDSIASK